MNNIFNTEKIEKFTKGFDLELNYLGDALLPNENHDNIQFAWMQTTGKDALPLMAQVSALDAEAPISQRPDAKEISAEVLLVKHKLNLTENLARIKKYAVGDDKIESFIFNDTTNLYRGVRARFEAMKMELFATGKITIKENNVDKEIDYGFDLANVFAVNLADPNADVIGLVRRVKNAAVAKGKKLTKAIISTKVLDLLRVNKGLLEVQRNSAITAPYTDEAFMSFLRSYMGVAFAVNDDVYAYEGKDGKKHTSRFYPEDRITFLAATQDGYGITAVSPTPEDEMLTDTNRIDNFATVTSWVENDPAANWVKVSAQALPIIADMDNIFIVYTE